MTLIDHITTLLKKDERLWSNDAEPILLQNKLIALVTEDDEELLKLLLSNEKAKSEFFKTIQKSFIFRKEKFIQFLTMDEFLPDSFTAFENKIGLSSNGKLLSSQADVSLVFPYKDCILEGGQDKEDAARDEIFYNTTLAPDEIDRLKEPKVLANWKRYDKDGEHKVDGVSMQDNLIIKGNNLLGLHSLLPIFRNEVKLIYIDPPYNTGGNEETFTYNNSFKHSTWLVFIKNRLELARELLRDDGFIAITIDHRELFYLGALADEIFLRENRVGIVSIVHKPEGRNQENFFGTSNEFMLVYAKNKDIADFERVILDNEQQMKFSQFDEEGSFQAKNFIRLRDGKYSLKENKPTHYYPIYVSKDLKDFSLEKKEGYLEALPITDKGAARTWKTKGDTFMKIVKEGRMLARIENNNLILEEKLREDQVIKTHWIKKEYHAYHYGTKLLEKILGRKGFSYPKSIHAVLDTLKLMTSEDDIILDFHAGSGTTAHATLQLNKEDGGKRRFILIEQLEEHIEICIERLQKVLKQENYSDSFVYFELLEWNKKYIDELEKAKTKIEIRKVKDKIEEEAFFRYAYEPEKFENKAFDELTEKEQKRALMDMLDMNHLYVNKGSMNDATFKVSEENKKLNAQFYSMK